MDPSVLLAQLGPSAAFLGLLVWFGRLYFSGRLIPRSTVQDMKENFTQQIARERQISNDWREVAINGTSTLTTLTSQNERLIEGQKTVEAFILSLSQSQPRRELMSGLGGTGE